VIERVIAIILLSLGGVIISYATGLCYHAGNGDEGARLATSGTLLGITLIAFGVIVDRDRRRNAAQTQAAAIASPPVEDSAFPPFAAQDLSSHSK
jgi:hypothetical protein